MPVLNDEIVLNIDGFVPFDPAKSLRKRANQLLASRVWTTKEVFYGDQAEPAEDDTQMWSFCFNLGLDHIGETNGRWRQDVEALVNFLQQVIKETGREILVEVRYRSRPWHSEHIAIVDEECPDLDEICEMIERVAR